jgi:acetyl esterase
MERTIVTRLIEAAFRGASAVARVAPTGHALTRGLEVATDLRYGAGVSQRFDLWRDPAAGPGPLPVLVYVHGGGFSILSKDTHWMFAASFARRGFLVVSVDYRLAPEHPYPAALEDVCAAWSYVITNIGAFGGDPSRIVVAGESAGANLSLALTIAACFRRPEPFARGVFDAGVVPRAALPACGFLEVSRPERYLTRPGLHPIVRGRIATICRYYLPGAAEGAELASPLCVLEGDAAPDRPLPPIFAVCGTADPVLDDTTRLGAALERRGVPGGVSLHEGGVHAFHAATGTRLGKQAWAATDRFLATVE